ncbi:MAG: aspartate-semialdehyde dehydrogenase [Patescibacteria group bacterium]|nr:aspartate-semialdehyde dehydrogenase [Patescibacteria group bacterium]
MKKLRVGILGATGMVGQRFVTLLTGHPWFQITALAASPRSRGKTYAQAVAGRWAMADAIPAPLAKLKVQAVGEDLSSIAAQADLVFCALDMDKAAIKDIEIAYAAAGIPVISNNSAHRWTDDIPMLIPEVNPEHAELIPIQRRKRGWKAGLIAVKPNCSIQTYVPVLTALRQFGPAHVVVTSLQAISGAGKTFATWPEMTDNVIPFIGGEEEKSEQEPLKIWGSLHDGKLQPATAPAIAATCIRVPVADGHLASVSVTFDRNPTKDQILESVTRYLNPIAGLNLPSAPKQFITYFDEPDRPQTGLDRGIYGGMGITMGRLRPGRAHDWQFIALSHNTIRGAAGGAILMAELLVAKGYIN